jgi:predicted nucleic acid-binding Zn ribbon protein
MTADQRRARRNQIIMFSVSVILVLSMVLSLTIKW